MGDHPRLLQRRHLVADGRAGEVEPVLGHERLGADGQGAFDVVLDDEGEDAGATI